MRSYDTAAVFRKSILTKDNPESMYVCVMVTLAALAKANPPNANASIFNYSLIDAAQYCFRVLAFQTIVRPKRLGVFFAQQYIPNSLNL